jgi:hypothetical protein
MHSESNITNIIITNILFAPHLFRPIIMLNMKIILKMRRKLTGLFSYWCCMSDLLYKITHFSIYRYIVVVFGEGAYHIGAYQTEAISYVSFLYEVL